MVSAQWGGEKWARFTERPVVCKARGAKAFLRKQLPCSGREPFHSRMLELLAVVVEEEEEKKVCKSRESVMTYRDLARISLSGRPCLRRNTH